MTSELVGISRFLSYVLRHQPQAIGITLDDAGWTDIETLLAALAAHGRPVSHRQLEQVIQGTDKQRLQVDGARIRAAQGHSIPIDLHLDPSQPPPVLYHGTVAMFLPKILIEGLQRQSRSHVHLSPDIATATAVAARRGEPVILHVNAAGMHATGHSFYQASNGIWLTDHVDPQWIQTPNRPQRANVWP